MKISVVQKQIQALPADALIVNLFEGVNTPGGATGAVDSALGASNGVPGDGAISRLIQLGDFKGKLNEVAVIYTHGLIPAPRVILVGLGKKEDLTLDRVRQASGVAARKARDLGCQRVTSTVHGGGLGGLRPRDAAQATVEGALLGVYQFREHKTAESSNGKHIDDLTLVEFNANRIADVEVGAHDGETIARGVNTARTLMNRAPNVLNPASLAEFAREMAAQSGLNCTILTEREIAEHKMGGILAVSQGSVHPPRFVILEYIPSHPPLTNERQASSFLARWGQRGIDAPLVFIGKGVTFDSGGISLKDPAGMESMKADMGGAAAVIGAMQAIGALKPGGRVIGLIPMAENMPSDRSYRPGDIVTMMSGATVEIISTDAEGRMLLADALHYARRYEPCGVVDLATLTGACVVALGEGIAAGLFANDDEWAQVILSAAQASGERLWHMPLFPEYGNKIRSDVADMKNSAGRYAGVGASAYFLKRFVEPRRGEGRHQDAYPWAHIDMAAMMFNPDTRGYQPKGAMGYGVRTLVALACHSRIL